MTPARLPRRIAYPLIIALTLASWAVLLMPWLMGWL